MKDMGLRIETEPTAALMPYARNAKRHTKEQVRQIANSIEEFGFADPVGVWTNAEGESEIVEGHGRVLAAQLLGIEEVPVIHLDVLTDEQRRAYALAHNQLTMSTGWDSDLLADEILDMAEFGIDLTCFGFSEFDVEYAIERVADAPLDDKELERYSEAGEAALHSFCVVLSCRTQDEKAYVARLLSVDPSSLKRLYEVRDLL